MILHTIMPLDQVMEGFDALKQGEYALRGGALLEYGVGAYGGRQVRRLISSDPRQYLSRTIQ